MVEGKTSKMNVFTSHVAVFVGQWDIVQGVKASFRPNRMVEFTELRVISAGRLSILVEALSLVLCHSSALMSARTRPSAYGGGLLQEEGYTWISN